MTMVMSREVRAMSWTPEGLAATIARAMADYRAEVGARLRRLREARDLSQEEAAHKVRVSSKTFLRWENGRAWPTPDNWKAITRYFGADPREGIPSPGPLGLSASNGKGTSTGNGPADVSLADVLAELQAFRTETGAHYAKLDAALRAVVSAWPGSGQKQFTLKDSWALLNWLRAGGSEPQSQDAEDHQEGAG